MTRNKYPLALAIVAGGALALWLGMPPLYLLFLACPVMMFFMIGGSAENPASRAEESEFPVVKSERHEGPVG